MRSMEDYDCVSCGDKVSAVLSPTIVSLVLCAVVEEFEGKRLKIDTFAFEEVSRILKSFL